MEKAHAKHQWRSNTLPALLTVGPVTLVLVLLVAIPLIYVVVMSFCSIDQYYNVQMQFTFDNYKRLVSANYLKIYAQSIMIAFVTTLLCILIGYPFSYIIARTHSKRKQLFHHPVLDKFTDPYLRMADVLGYKRMAQYGIAVSTSDEGTAGSVIQTGNDGTRYGLLPDSVYDPAVIYGD